MRSDNGSVGKGVVVLGMHRSGTSAVSGLVHLAGVPLPDRKYRLGRGVHNPNGFWEISTLNAFNESLLRRFEGDWSAPPPLPDGWTEHPKVRSMKARARRLFLTVMPKDAWLWKDPRLCLTMPFWSEMLGPSPVVFLVVRNPLEVARSLERRNGFSQPLSIALWERYTRGSAAAAAGLAVEVVSYDRVMSDPVGWVRDARTWMTERGVRCSAMAPEASVRELIDPQLRHARHSIDDVRNDPAVSANQFALYAGLLERAGYRDRFVPPDLPEMTPWAAALLDERRPGRKEVHRYHRRRRAVAGQAARLVRWFR